MNQFSTVPRAHRYPERTGAAARKICDACAQYLFRARTGIPSALVRGRLVTRAHTSCPARAQLLKARARRTRESYSGHVLFRGFCAHNCVQGKHAACAPQCSNYLGHLCAMIQEFRTLHGRSPSRTCCCVALKRPRGSSFECACCCAASGAAVHLSWGVDENA